MRKSTLIFMFLGTILIYGQIVPENSFYNENIVWENVFTIAGKVKSDGNCAVVFMPENMSRH